MRSVVRASGLVCVLLASGCSFLNTGATAGTPQPGAACTALSRLARDRTPTVQELVVVIDRSASTQDAESGGVPDWYTAIFGGRGVAQADGSISFGAEEKALIPSLPTPAVVKVGAFDGGRRVDWQGAPVYLPRMSGGESNRREFAGNAGACFRHLVGEAARSPAGKKGSNVMTAFQVGQRGSGTARRTLVVATDGLATTGCADLRTTAMRDSAHADRIIRSCAAQQAVPDLKGWEVRLPWVGSVGAGHPEPQEPHLEWLRRLWTGLCEKATGTADRCVVDSGIPPSSDEAEPAEEGAEDLTITFPSVERRPNPVQVERLPGDLLFATDSDQVSPEGLEALAAFAEKVTPKAPEWLEVIGHTDDQGDAAYNVDLSTRRAESVRQVLEEAGMTGIRVKGLGESLPEPGCRGTTAKDRQCNRRVEIKYKVRG
ncbi:OmpA family protein [Streptosporangium sp. NPDC002721]|uniref:OmpA family protein n=1 Tax=Streptosporangium sp. NPDC002721 TaxID=3366188 RepID=UPI0036BE0D40